MDYGTLKFEKVGSSEVVLETPWVPAALALVKARLAECGNHALDADEEAMATYGVYYVAELAGHKVVDLPAVEEIKASDLYMAKCVCDFELVKPEGAEDEGEGDENPTATKGARS